MRIAVVGAGYVGVNCGAALAYIGHRVSVIERSQERLELLRAGRSPIHEHGLSDLLVHPSVRSRISFHDGPAEPVPLSDMVMIAVGTPPRRNGQADTRYVEEAAGEVAAALRPGQRVVLVVKSTVPVGTNRRVRSVVERTLQQRGVACEALCASNPEFLREGRALADMLYPDRIVVGAETDDAVDALHRLYRPILEQSFDPPPLLDRPQGYALPRLIVTSPESAELIKYASNAFLATKISFINEVAGLCERLGADVVEVARGMGLDSRIGPGFLQAGLGWGGSCFPKDTSALISMGCDHDYAMPLLQATVEVNRRQRQHAIDRLQNALKGLRGRTVGLLGLTFKAGTDDARESPALDLIPMLLDRGAYVQVHDPVALGRFRHDPASEEVACCDEAVGAAAGADGLIVATEWPEYRDLDWDAVAAAMRTPVVLDGRNCLDVSRLERAGITVLRIGQ
ncbi:MAG TPA: UDP-glucose/GDP-mannose dehydrogenase family protein [Chthonomonadales bacterium]|nr:UDP-glucose/GDP-mannose dehydrogenase family protein [Chthonomonadales bacterium]